MKKVLLFIFCLVSLRADNSSYYLGTPTILGPNGAAQPFVCQTSTCASANANSEVLYIKTISDTGCARPWSMDVATGTNINELAGYTGLPSNTYTSGSASWSSTGGGQAVYNYTPGSQSILAGQTVSISGYTPSGYNVSAGSPATVLSVTTNTFTIALSNPGAYVSGGSVVQGVQNFNASTPRYSPDGQWIIMAYQDPSVSGQRLCTVQQAKPGAGFGYGLYVCRVSNTTCYPMSIMGDNNAHCTMTPSAACPVTVSGGFTTSPVDNVHGVLHWYFTPDQTKIYGMYVMGATMATPERLNGTARWASITLPGSGAPTLSNITETDPGPLGNGTGANNWYEGAGALPLSVEASTCTLYFTSINNADGAFNHTSILQYNICTQTATYLPPSTAYQEHWNSRTQGDIAIGIDAEYLPSTLPFCLCGGVSGPTDLSIGPPTVGKTQQLTFYNNQRPLGNPVTSMSDPGWDWTGNYVIAEYVLQNNTTHVASIAYILKYPLITTPTASIQVSGVTLAGTTLQ